MSSLDTTLKIHARSLRGSVRAFLRRRKYRPVPGAPVSLSADLLAEVTARLTGSLPARVEHIHLSAWKDSGAYRVLVKTRAGKSISLIYKDAVYLAETLPALSGLPYHPGPPEYELSRRPHPLAETVMPQVYHAEEVVAGQHYRYLFRDLTSDHKRLKDRDDCLRIARRLPEFHQTLARWFSDLDSSRLLCFDPPASRQLLDYIEQNLSALNQRMPSDRVGQMLELLPQVARIQAGEFSQPVIPLQAIHGDLNYTNLYTHTDGSFKAVDWEWAGFGYPHLDLAVLLKGQPELVEKSALADYAAHNLALSTADHHRLYYWTLLERSLLDAAYIAAQHLQATSKPIISLPNFIHDALRRALRAYQELTH